MSFPASGACRSFVRYHVCLSQPERTGHLVLVPICFRSPARPRFSPTRSRAGFACGPPRQDGGHNSSDLRAATFMCFTTEREAIICSLVNLERDIEPLATSLLTLS